MRLSKTLVPTLKEAPAEAEVPSHILMVRGGYLRKVAAGIYSFLPLGWRVIQKVTRIIREEMNRTGASEVFLPAVIPARRCQASGRWDQYGAQRRRLKDRKGGDFVIGPTHEEVITALVRGDVRSYRQLPLNLYQIQTKFRDELRPRAGLMRGREFIMKDAYSFHVDEKDATREYHVMYDTYTRIFQRCGLKFRAVEADTAVREVTGAPTGLAGPVGLKAPVHVDVEVAAMTDLVVGANQADQHLTGVNIDRDFTPAARGDYRQAAPGDRCARCADGTLHGYRGVEVGQVFFLGTKYSKPMGCNFLDADGVEKPMPVGCYGIGGTR